MTAPPITRADPQHRLHRRTRRSLGIWRDAKTAWSLTFMAWRRMPALFGLAVFLWAAIRFGCLYGLHHVHLAAGGALTLIQAAGLLAMALIVDLGPLVLAACLWPPAHRLILGEPAPRWTAWAARSARMLAAAAMLALGAGAALGVPLATPLLLLRALGRVSTLLALILLLPGTCFALLCLLRLSLGLPAISLGLPRALAEGWTISRFHVSRTLCVWLPAYLPVIVVMGGWLAAPLDRSGWAEAIVRPVLDVAMVSLTGSLTGLFYRRMRLPRELRPDVRPSWNRSLRREPIIT